jgi:sialidase-1
MRPNNGLSVFFMMLFLSAVCVQAVEQNQPVYKDLFVSGQDGYHTYRIPSIITTQKGTILAFCEGRKNSKSDTGDIDMLLKRSIDGGKTFCPQTIIWNDANNTCGNPCPVVDSNDGTIWLLTTWNAGNENEKQIKQVAGNKSRCVYTMYSRDDGVSWSKPVEITKDVKKKQWRWYATGPGVGIQLKYGTKKGRLVIPCDYSEKRSNDPNREYGSHIIYSDDHGKSWHIGGTVKNGVNECQIVECLDGSLILNMRNHNKTGSRAIAYSYDGGQTFKNISFTSNLQEPRCQASIIRYSPNKFTDKNIILFSNPNHAKKRLNMMVKLSYDEGKMWSAGKCLYEGPSAYSCLTVLPDGKIGGLYEAGEKMPYEKIVLAIFDISCLTR